MIDNKEEGTFTVLKYNLSKYFPIRIVLSEDEARQIKGLCEDSFSMSYSDYNVRIWWSGKAYSLLGEHTVNGIADAEHNAGQGDKILDPFSVDCPVEIDWDYWIKSTDKYSQRNAKFKMRKGV